MKGFTDEGVIEASRGFAWVKVDRDVDPTVPKRFGVTGYPTLLALTPDGEKIHRWSGFRTLELWRPELDEANRRAALWKAGEEWDPPPTRPDRLCDEGELSSIPTPGSEWIRAITAIGDRLYLIQDGKLRVLDAKTGDELESFAAPGRLVVALATDGKRLYAVPFGWSKGDPIQVVDPANGEVVREVVSEANAGKKAMATKGAVWVDGKLAILSSGRLHRVDVASGEFEPPVHAGAGASTGLAFDGERFITLGRQREDLTRSEIIILDPAPPGAKAMKIVRRIKSAFLLRQVLARPDGALLLTEGVVEGFDKKHRKVKLFPDEIRVHRLVLPEPDGD